MKKLFGGSKSGVHFGPCIVKEGYSTTANGWADTIEAKAGEVAIMLSAGSPSSFACWIVGTPEEIVADLIRRANETEDGSRAERLRMTAAEIGKRATEGASQEAARAMATEYRRLADEMDAVSTSDHAA